MKSRDDHENANNQAYLSAIKQDFSVASSTYGQYSDPQQANYLSLFAFARHTLQWQIPDLTSQSMLDVGSGSCTGLNHLLQEIQVRPAQVVALDLSESMLQQCSEETAHRLVANMHCLPLKSNQFGLVVSNFTLHWSYDLRQALQEIIRVLQPGAIAMLSFPLDGSFELLKQAWQAQNLVSPVHPMLTLANVLNLCNSTHVLQQLHYQERWLPIEQPSAKTLLTWLKLTGVRPKSLVSPRITKAQYKNIINSLDMALQQGQKLKFKMVDLLVVK